MDPQAPEKNPYADLYQQKLKEMTPAGPTQGQSISPDASSASESVSAMGPALLSFGGNVLKGGLKGAGDFIRGLGESSSMGTPTADYISRSPNLSQQNQATENAITRRLTPIGVGQHLGYYGEKATEALAPGMPKAVSVARDIADPLNAYRASMPLEEAIGRKATDILKPNPAEYRGMSSNIAENLPYIKPIVGNKFKNPLEFAKSAQAPGQEYSNFYRENFIDPDEMTLGEPFRRVTEINNKLRPMYRARTMGQEMTNLDRDPIAELEAERDALNNHIYETASARTGVPPEIIRGINQRGAQLQSIGDQADAAQALRRSGYSAPGIPFTKGEALMNLIKGLRGGPENIAGRQLTRIMREVPGEVEELPSVEGIRNYRRMSDAENLGTLKGPLSELETMRANRPTTGMQGKMPAPELRTIQGPDLTPDTEGALAAPSTQARTQRFMDLSQAQNAARDASRAEMTRIEGLKAKGAALKSALKAARESQ